VGGWMDGWMDGRTDGRADGRIDGWTNRRTNERMDRQTPYGNTVVVLHSKKIALTEVSYFSKIYYGTKFQNPKISSTIFVPTSDVRTAIVWCYKDTKREWPLVGCSYESLKYPSTGSNVIRKERHTSMIPQVFHYNMMRID
jgi:hypothetical protein